METALEQNAAPFVERRNRGNSGGHEGSERRQFAASTTHLSPDVAELAQAVDRYKLVHRRRFITFEELHAVITELGYHK
jgi:hypothetical protein